MHISSNGPSPLQLTVGIIDSDPPGFTLLKSIRNANTDTRGCSSRKMDSNVGSDRPTVEELLQRIRDKARARSSESTKRMFGGASPSLLQGSDFYSLQELKEYAAAAYVHHNEVGRINPRNPGLRNDMLQFAKKIIQRTLDWYTRPLHLFQGSTARTLMEASRALEDIQQKQLNLSQQIALLESELRAEIQKLKTIAGNTQPDTRPTELPRSADSHAEPEANQNHL